MWFTQPPPLHKYNLKSSSLFSDPVSHRIYHQSKPLANQHVTIRSKSSSSPRCGPLNLPERKTTCSTRHIHSADMTLSTKQLKRPTLRVMYLQKSLWRARACLLHFSPDWQHTPGEARCRTRTLIQSDTPDLSRAARLAHRALRPARLKRPHDARQAVPPLPTSAPPYCHF